VNPGAIVAEDVSRRFRVYPKRHVTLKEAIVRARHLRPTDIWALQDVSFEIAPGEAVGLVGRNGSGKTTLLRLIAGIFGPTSGRIEVGGTVGSLLEIGAGFHPDFTGRENVYLNGAIHGLSRTYVRERMDEIVSFAELERFVDLPVRTYSAGMYMRLGFSVATHLSTDVLLLDEVFAVGDEAFQRKCFGKIFEFKSRGGTIVFVSHSAAAVESLCERTILLRAGRVLHDGETHEAIAAYHQLLAEDEDPDERNAGLQEWGTGEVRVAELRLEDVDGAERRQYLSGEPLLLRMKLTARERVPPPRLTLDLREATGALVGSAVADLGELGWDVSRGELELVYELARIPLAEGRFQAGVGLTDPESGRILHHLERAAEFVVVPEDDAARGPVRLDGSWRLAGSEREIPAR
jgi:ABC-type polysaccharide/polyol phosphate transport system ATPase subunit